MSSRLGDVVSAEFPQDCKDFASNIAFEATDDLSLAHSLPGAATHVCLGLGIIT